MTTTGGGAGRSNATKTQSIQRAMVRLGTNILIVVPNIPFASDHDVSGSVAFTSALRNTVELVGVAFDDTNNIARTKGERS